MIKLKADQKEEILELIKMDIREDETFYQETILPALQERWNIFDASPEYYASKFKFLTKRCDFVATDFANVVGWMLPFLDGVFNSNRQVLKVVVGTENSDSKAAEVLNKLIKKQLTKDNDGFSLIHLWNTDALITNWAWLMGWWERNVKELKTVTETVDEQTLDRYQKQTLIEVVSTEEIEDAQGTGLGVYNVEYKVFEYTRNRPVLELMPQWEVLVDSKCRNYKAARRMFHRRTDVTASDLMKMRLMKDKEGEPIYDVQAINRILKQGGSSDKQSKDGLKQQVEGNKEEGKNIHPSRREYTVYEGFDQLPIGDKGTLQTVLVTVCNNEILRVEDEEVSLPFVLLSTQMEPHRLFANRGLADLMGQLQHIRTALWRLIIINAAKVNNPRTLYNPEAIDPDDMEGEFDLVEMLRTINQGDIYELNIGTLDPLTFQFLENITVEEGERSGITDFTKGNHGTKKIADTATGVTAVMSAANKILEQTARVMGETGYADLYRLLVDMNIKYCDPETVFRLTGEWFDLSTINAEWDVELQAGLALSTKEQSLASIQLLYQLLMELKGAGWPYVDDQNVYNLIARMAEEIGEKGIEEFVHDPEEFDKEVLNRAFGGGENGNEEGAQGAPSGAGTDRGEGENSAGVPGAVV